MRKNTIIRKIFISLVGVLFLGIVGCGNKTTEEKADDQSGKEEKPLFGAEILESYENGSPIALWASEEDMPYYDASITEQAISTITPYITEKENKGGSIIICPGGGYQKVGVEAEGEEPALALNELGISAFVLDYRVVPYSGQAIITDVMRAVRYVRYHAETFGIDPEKIAIMGFSAGGHLSAMALEHYDEDTQKLDRIDEVSARPDLGILCYGVLKIDESAVDNTFWQPFFEGEELTAEELVKKYSPDKGVTKDTPPCFVWHSKKDKTVPYDGSEAFANAMQQAGVECQLHIYEDGGHGIVLAKDQKEKGMDVGDWFDSCISWLREKGF